MTTERRRQANGPYVRLPGFHVTPEQRDRLTAWADQAGMTVPRFAVDRIFRPGVPALAIRAVFSELTGIRRQVTGWSSNFNQLTRQANTSGQVDPDTLAELFDELIRQGEVIDAVVELVEKLR